MPHILIHILVFLASLHAAHSHPQSGLPGLLACRTFPSTFWSSWPPCMLHIPIHILVCRASLHAAHSHPIPVLFLPLVVIWILYVHVCVDGRVTRTGRKTRPRPKIVILPIKINQSTINQSPLSLSLSLSLSHSLSPPLCLSVCLSLSLSLPLSLSLSLPLSLYTWPLATMATVQDQSINNQSINQSLSLFLSLPPPHPQHTHTYTHTYTHTHARARAPTQTSSIC